MRSGGLPAALWIGLFWVGSALAQVAAPPTVVRTPKEVPPTSELAPVRSRTAEDAALPAAAPQRELEKPDDEIAIDVTGFSTDESAPAEVRAALGRLTARFVGKQRSFEDLVNAANEVTRFMQRDLGYYLGYAYLPEQTPADGVIRIAVLEGRLDRVVLNWRDGLPVKREVVEAYLARLEPGSVLKVRDVERIVFLVNDLRGLTARFEVRAGSRPGTSTLVVTPSPENVWSGKADFDANGSRALGLYRFSGLAQMNSPLGRGDGLTANALASTTGGLAFALVGYTTPIGSDGLKIGTSLSGVHYQLDKSTFQLDLNGTASTINAYGLYPVVRSRNLNLFTLASAESKQYEDRQGQVNARSRKSVTTYALGTTGDFRDSVLGGGVNTYEASVVGGSVAYPDGRSSALDDDPRFTKFTFGYSRLQDWITGRALIYFNLRGQYAANNLDTTEQFRLGGPEGVRAFASGDGTGDMGTVGSLELRLLPPEDWVGRIAREIVLSAFIDGGYVQYRYRARVTSDPNAGKNHAVLGGAGVGMSWVRPGAYALRMSVARSISSSAAQSDSQSGKLRLYLQATRFFN
jgi:hemolysin activation/secretion protein